MTSSSQTQDQAPQCSQRRTTRRAPRCNSALHPRCTHCFQQTHDRQRNLRKSVAPLRFGVLHPRCTWRCTVAFRRVAPPLHHGAFEFLARFVTQSARLYDPYAYMDVFATHIPMRHGSLPTPPLSTLRALRPRADRWSSDVELRSTWPKALVVMRRAKVSPLVARARSGQSEGAIAPPQELRSQVMAPLQVSVWKPATLNCASGRRALETLTRSPRGGRPPMLANAPSSLGVCQWG